MFLLHPVVVHFAIALLAVAVVTDLLALVSKKENLRQMAVYLLYIGTAAAIGAVLSGLQAVEVVKVPDEAAELVADHRLSGIITMWLFVALTAMRYAFDRMGLMARPVKWVYYLLSIVALAFLLTTGTRGGNMVYFHGVGIDPSKIERPAPQKPGFGD